MHEQPQMAAESGMVDDGKGAKEIFRVDSFDLLQVLRKFADQLSQYLQQQIKSSYKKNGTGRH